MSRSCMRRGASYRCSKALRAVHAGAVGCGPRARPDRRRLRTARAPVPNNAASRPKTAACPTLSPHGSCAYSPREIAQRVDDVAVAKASLPLSSLILLGMLAGAFIGLGALYY